MAAALVMLVVLLGLSARVIGAGLRSPTFAPRSQLEWVRRAVVVAVAIPGVMLIGSLTTRWYVVNRGGDVDVIDGHSAFARAIVVLGLASGVLTVRGVYGRRNWSIHTLVVAWILLAGTWLEASPLFVMDPDGMTSRRSGGLALATTALALMTVGAAVGVVLRRGHLEL